MKGKKYKSVLYTTGDPIVLRNKIVEGVFIEDIKNIHELSKRSSVKESAYENVIGPYDDKIKKDIEEIVYQGFAGTDFFVSVQDIDLIEGKIYLTVGAFGTEPMEREAVLEFPSLDYNTSINNAIEEWRAAHNSPDNFYESAKPKKKIVESNRVHKMKKREGRSLKEEVSDEAYKIAEYIDKEAQKRLQDIPSGEKVLRRDDFDELFEKGVKKIYKLNKKDMENLWDDGELLPPGTDQWTNLWDLEIDIRGILSYMGYETIYESDDERGADEGDLVLLKQEPIVEQLRAGKKINESVKVRKSLGVKKVVKEGKETKKGYWLDSDEYNAIDKLSVGKMLEDSFILGNYDDNYDQEVEGDTWWDFENDERVDLETGLYWLYETLEPEDFKECDLTAKEKKALLKLFEKYGLDTAMFKNTKAKNESVKRINLKNIERMLK